MGKLRHIQSILFLSLQGVERSNYGTTYIGVRVQLCVILMMVYHLGVLIVLSSVGNFSFEFYESNVMSHEEVISLSQG